MTTFQYGLTVQARLVLLSADAPEVWFQNAGYITLYHPVTNNAEPFLEYGGGQDNVKLIIEYGENEILSVEVKNNSNVTLYNSTGLTLFGSTSELNKRFEVVMTSPLGSPSEFTVALDLSQVSQLASRPVPATAQQALGRMPSGMNEFLKFAQGWVPSIGNDLAVPLQQLRTLWARSTAPSSKTKPNQQATKAKRSEVEAVIRSKAGRSVQKTKAPQRPTKKTPPRLGPYTVKGSIMTLAFTGRPKTKSDKWFTIQITSDLTEDAEGSEESFTTSPAEIGLSFFKGGSTVFVRGRWVVMKDGQFEFGVYSRDLKVIVPHHDEDSES